MFKLVNRKKRGLDEARAIILFGGGGYIGTALQVWLQRKTKWEFIVIDNGICPSKEQVHTFLGYKPEHRYLVHLACPRKFRYARADVFTAHATEALSEGMDVASGFAVPPENCFYFSSQSIYDTKENPYSAFKTAAETIVSKAGWIILRPGTVFGRCANLPIRGDTAVNCIAQHAASRGKAYADSTCRRISFLDDVAMGVIRLINNDKRGLERFASKGRIKYSHLFKPLTCVKKTVKENSIDIDPTLVAYMGDNEVKYYYKRLMAFYYKLLTQEKKGG